MTAKRRWPKKKSIAVVVDTRGWFDPFADQLVQKLIEYGHNARLFTVQSDVVEGDVAFYLSCMRLTSEETLNLYDWNFVVHASDLPKGKGFSPIVWQILEGINRIPVTMIEMVEEADSGGIVHQNFIEFSGTELNNEIRQALGNEIVDMCLKTANQQKPPKIMAQKGTPSWYRRRYPADSELNPYKPISDQFDLLRVVDNDSYPAFFNFRGNQYILRIENVGQTDPSNTATQKTLK